jgi:hypothetical protein
MIRLGFTALLMFLLVGVAPVAAEGEELSPPETSSIDTTSSPWPAPPDALAPQVTVSALPAIRASGASLSASTPLSFTLTNLDSAPQVTATISATGASPGNLHVDTSGLALATTSTATSTTTEVTLRGTPADVTTALAERLSWTAPSQIGQVTISAEVRQDLPADTYFNPDNGHYYRFIFATQNFDSAINSAAASRLWGLPGYLVTITTLEEQQFVSTYANTPAGTRWWLGATDASPWGAWTWITGPEVGQRFWTGGTEVRRAENTVDGRLRVNWWANGQPDNDCSLWNFLICLGTREDHVIMRPDGEWNDVQGSNSYGAIYEYGTGATPGVDRGVTSNGIVVEVVDRLTPMIRFADGLDATTPVAAHWTEAGVTGVSSESTAAMLASALSSPDLTGSRVATLPEAQAFVDALLKVHAFATSPNTAARPSLSDYQTIGILGLTSATRTSLNSALAVAGPDAVSDYSQLQTLAANVIAASLIPEIVPTPTPVPPENNTDPTPQEREEDESKESEEAAAESSPPETPVAEESVTEEALTDPSATEDLVEVAVQEITYVIAPTATGTPAGLPIVARLDGSLVRLSPMVTYALINGNEVPVSVSRVDETTIRLSGPGFEVSLRSSGPNGTEASIDDQGRLILVHEGELSIESTGYRPGSRIDTWLFSTPTFLGGGSVGSSGMASSTLKVPATLSPGSHTFQVSGLSPEGAPLAVSIGVLVEASDGLPGPATTPSVPNAPTVTEPPRPEKAPPFAPFSALDAPAALVSAAVSGMALLAVASGAAGAAAGMRGASSQGSRGGAATEERSELSGIYVTQLDVELDGRGRGDTSALWRWPGTALIDRFSIQTPIWLAPRWPMVARIVDDGSALRAMFGSLSALVPLAGIVLGILAVLDTTGIAMPPATGLAIAIILLGTIDTFAGFLAFTVFAIGVTLSGGIIDVDSIRALMGIAVVFFGPALLAGAFRSIRRPPPTNGDERWERITDYVVVPLIAAMSAQAMVGALSGVAGVEFPLSYEANRIALLVLVAMFVRIALEDVVSRWFPARLQSVTAAEKPAPSTLREGISAVTKTGVYLFVVVAIIGNVWQLWVAGAMFAIPMLLGLFADRLPNSPIVWRLLPQGVPSIVTTLLVSTWFAVLLERIMGETEAYAQTGFMMFGLPFLAMGLMGLVGREPAEDEVRWNQQPRWKLVYRVGGIAMLCWGAYLHLNA